MDSFMDPFSLPEQPPDLNIPVPEQPTVPCHYDPMTAKGTPVGMYHCPACGCMVLAGRPHGSHDWGCWLLEETNANVP